MVQQDQLQSDNVLEDVACMLGCTRSSLHGANQSCHDLLLSPLVPGADLHMSLQCSDRSNSEPLPTRKQALVVVEFTCTAVASSQLTGKPVVQRCLCLAMKADQPGRAVVASEKGVVVGRLSFREDGDLINCQRMGVGGKAVPPNVDKVHRLQLAENQHPFSNEQQHEQHPTSHVWCVVNH